MEVYAASDGYVLQLSKALSDYSSVDELSKAIAPHLDLKSENILLFLEDGREVKDRVLSEALDRGGVGQGSKPKSEVLYLFNRETFWTEPEEWADKYREEVFWPPPLDPGAIHDLTMAHEPFLMAQDHIHHILSLFQAQYRALSLAYQNLEHHLQPLRDEWDSLARVADTQLREQESLLDSAPSDLLLLPRVTIHPVFWSKRDQAGNIIVRAKDEAKDKTLADYIHPRKMEEVMETCRVSHGDMRGRFLQLAGQMDETIQISEVERSRAEESAMAVQLEFDRVLQRLQDSLQDMADAPEIDQLVEAAMNHDEVMRADLSNLTALKNDYTLDVHIHLRQVAQLQSRIAEVVTPLTSLEGDFKSKGAFPHLSRLHELPFAYLALVLEYRWRKEFGEHFGQWCNRIAGAISGMLAPEIKRREAINKEVLSFNPFSIHGLEDSTTPFCETSYHTGSEALEVLNLDKSLSDDLDEWIRRLGNDIEANFPPGHERDALYDVVRQLTARYEDFKLQLFGQPSLTLEQRWDSEGESRHSQQNADNPVATQLRLSRALQDSAEPGLGVRQHDELIEGYQQRQEAMEEELARLRAELGDEALARQALSAEMEERNRASEDRQRDREDQSELVAALHAEVAQEKDRATDLGVRLQEALLDVDGLKNAEQTLIGQLQQLREERSKHFQDMSQANSDLDDIRTTLAGIRAESEATKRQLAEVQEERDAALKNQSNEAQRLMRDRIAEMDGDRAVLEHQNLDLHRQLEDLKIGMEEKLNSTRNTAVRQVDGYKAELSLSKAQLRDAQRREAVLSDELAMLKDSANALSADRTHQSEVVKDAVAIVTRYYETCRPLLRLVNSAASSRRAGSDEADKENDQEEKRPPSAASAAPSTAEMRESVLTRGLAAAQGFDLDAFSEAINRLVVRLKRYTKGYKHMRDVARNKITFTDFQKGDVVGFSHKGRGRMRMRMELTDQALFLPTRDPSRRHWAAFNVNAPHHFLKADDKMQEEAKTRDWIMARITSSEEAVAGETNETNPLGLTNGVRYQIHGTEPFDPTAVPRAAPRRSTSMGANSLLFQDSSPKQSSRLRSLTPGAGGILGLAAGAPEARLPNETPSALSTSLRDTAPLSMSPAGITQKPDGYFPPMSDMATALAGAATSGTVPMPSLGHVVASAHADKPKEPPAAEHQASVKVSPHAIPMRTSHHRTSSRSTTSPSLRDTPIFAPSSVGRPASVASSSSSHPHPRGIPIGPPGGKAAPAMAITTSDGSGGHSPGNQGPFLDRPRRPSASSFASGPREEAGSIGRSPLGLGKPGSSGTSPAPPEGRVDASGSGTTPRTISRGFSIGGLGKKRTASNASAQTAVDILKQYGDKK